VKSVAEEASLVGGGGRVDTLVADLALMSNVRMLAEKITARYARVDVLANNAGALFASRKETSEGFEQTFALNHLAPFLLTNLLRDRLAGGRVVTTASGAHRSARLDVDDLQSQKSYSARVYGTSKLCNILFTCELAKRASELHANCFHPGVVRTGFAKNENGVWKAVATLGAPFFRSPERGARSLVWLALSDDAAELTGQYIEDDCPFGGDVGGGSALCPAKPSFCEIGAWVGVRPVARSQPMTMTGQARWGPAKSVGWGCSTSRR
jgi:NAD(P)-dependent dehydrogenase (short-subunit alcohol dehydrogenase family)